MLKIEFKMCVSSGVGFRVPEHGHSLNIEQDHCEELCRSRKKIEATATQFIVLQLQAE